MKILQLFAFTFFVYLFPQWIYNIEIFTPARELGATFFLTLLHIVFGLIVPIVVVIFYICETCDLIERVGNDRGRKDKKYHSIPQILLDLVPFSLLLMDIKTTINQSDFYLRIQELKNEKK
jgi:hypothetical protein